MHLQTSTDAKYAEWVDLDLSDGTVAAAPRRHVFQGREIALPGCDRSPEYGAPGEGTLTVPGS